MKKDLKILNQDTVYHGFFRMEKQRLQHTLFAGGWSGEITRELFVRGNCVAVVLYDVKRDEVILIEQFRIGAAENPINTPWLIEIVAGVIEDDETAEDVARRESLEEAGCEILDLIRINSFYLSPGGSSEQITLFCGLINSENVGGIHGLAEEHEDILVRAVPFSEAYRMVESNEIDSAIPVIALQWLALHRHKLNELSNH
ncbi:MAG: NUDIX domain-containing protein [Methylococcales bacterium]|nr:NUDIX domain-containing protein [Methylococcales bacterium]MDD5753654.1 NUDIX domain-containing protein [Methylococcales bacterium]